MNYFEESSKFFKTPLQEFIFYDKYSRYRYDLGRRETWIETVERTVEFLKELSNNKLSKEDYGAIYDAILNLKVMPSMRLVAMAGEAARREHFSVYNCSFLTINSIDALAEIMLLSMAGVGVGYSVQKKYTNQLPELPDKLIEVEDIFTIEDTTQGWVDTIKYHLQSLYGGKIVKFDYSQIRPAGAVLKIKGGRASGPDVLEECIGFITKIFNEAVGRKLKPLELHDIACCIGYCSISGGVRRTALISLFDIDDEEMLNCKNVDESFINYRWFANNSAVWEDEPEEELFHKQMDTMFNGMTGEPGIFSLRNARELAPKRRDGSRITGLNPCQPAFANVLTPSGIKQFGSINIGDVIWSGKQWTNIINKVSTGVKPVFKYKTTFGSFIGTKNHEVFQNGSKIEAKYADGIDIIPGPLLEGSISINPQDVMDGLVLGDGSVHKASNNLVYLNVGENDSDYFDSNIKHLFIKPRESLSSHDTPSWEIKTTITDDELPYTHQRKIPDRFFFGTNSKKAGFLRGLFSANGTCLKSGIRVMLKQTSLRLVEQVQEMLSSLGIRSYITTNRPKTVKFSNGEYLCRESYDLNITSDRYLFINLIGFIQKYKNRCTGNVVRRNITSDIVNIEYLGHFPVYDITVDAKEHSYWTGGLLVSNCGEVTLRDQQTCNLSSVICREDDTIQSLGEKIVIATVIGTIQSMADDFKNVREGWKINQQEERLLGVDLNGQMDCPILREDKYGIVHEFLRDLAVDINKKYANKLGINQAAAVTCCKPNGNSSQLVDSSSGIHPRYSKYYIRNVRVSVHSPIYKVLFEAGTPMSPENGEDWSNIKTAVVGFPIKSPEGSKTRDDFRAIDICNFWKINKQYYTEMNPSVTINYKEDEKDELREWVWKNRNIVGGMAFLPHSDAKYDNMPYVEITKEEYEKRVSEFPKIDWSRIEYYETEDMTTATQEIACMSGQCEI